MIYLLVVIYILIIVWACVCVYLCVVYLCFLFLFSNRFLKRESWSEIGYHLSVWSDTGLIPFNHSFRHANIELTIWIFRNKCSYQHIYIYTILILQTRELFLVLVWTHEFHNRFSNEKSVICNVNMYTRTCLMTSETEIKRERVCACVFVQHEEITKFCAIPTVLSSSVL